MQLLELNTTEDKFINLLNKDPDRLGELYKKIIERKFHIGEADISRKTLNHWEKENLLPYPFEGEGWTKFSFIEYVWLRCISELRNLGLPIEKIKVIKDALFKISVEEYKQFFFDTIKATSETVKERNEILAVFKRKDLSEEFWQAAFNELQISYFTILLLDGVINNRNTAITLDKNNIFRAVVFGKPPKLGTKANEEYFSDLIKTSFILINILDIVKTFFVNDKLKLSNDYITGFLNAKEKKIIDAIQSGNINEITIHFQNDEPVRMEVSDKKITNSVVNKVSRFLKEGEYNTIKLQTRNGKLINYERKDIIKL